MKIDRLKVYEKYEGHCAYCGREIKFKEMQVDHIIPKRMFLKIEDNPDYFENLNPSCRRCNHYKRAQSLEEFRQSVYTLNERITKMYICKVAIDFGVVKICEWKNEFFFEWYNKKKVSK